jgi:hypothetical protein
MTADQIFQNLKTLAPNIAFTVYRELDPLFEWDGEGPAPANLDAYDIFVKATTIENGEIITGETNIGGCYMREDEEIGDVHGYLPQKLDEAADDLKTQLTDTTQIDQVIAFLNQEMNDRWQQERMEK